MYVMVAGSPLNERVNVTSPIPFVMAQSVMPTVSEYANCLSSTCSLRICPYLPSAFRVTASIYTSASELKLLVLTVTLSDPFDDLSFCMRRVTISWLSDGIAAAGSMAANVL